MALSCLILTLGCKQNNPANRISEESSTQAESVSKVPLRLLIVNRAGDHELLKRQWLSVSDQPLDIQTEAVEKFLNGQSCDCDIVLYPARLLGELVYRGWLTKTKDSSDERSASQEDSAGAKPLPAAWKQQTIYAGVQWAKPLGCSIPILLVDRQSGFDAEHGPENWEQVLQGLNKRVEGSTPDPANGPSKFDPSKCDSEALVDRFLTIANRFSPRNANYGLLFEMQTMKPRIADPEFVEAARVLMAIAAASENSIAASGSWQDAWSWLAKGHPKACTVGLSGGQSEANEPVTVINACDLPSSGIEGQKGSQALRSWNTGGGLLASLSESCRQSSRAEGFVRWLSEPSTRDALAKNIPGIGADSPVYGSDSSAWQVTQLQRSIASRNNQPPELRFPQTEAYRAALAKQLIRILSGETEILSALKQTAVQWDQITDTAGRKQQRTEYEYSLGLSQ